MNISVKKSRLRGTKWRSRVVEGWSEEKKGLHNSLFTALRRFNYTCHNMMDEEQREALK
jgi:hypothetical protein